MKTLKHSQSNLGKQIIEKIKKEDIKQTPRSVFIMRRSLIWIFLFISIVIGSVSLSITAEYLLNADWTLLHKLGVIKISTIFMPLFWIAFLFGASVLAYYNFRHTDKGYKLHFIKIVGINIILSLFFGILLFFSGVNHFIEGKMQNYIPKYREIFVHDKISRMIQVWQNEDAGLLIGKIQEVNTNTIIFQDSNTHIWNIDISNTQQDSKHNVSLQAGEKIKIIGTKTSDSHFIAQEIRPFMGEKSKK